MENTSEYNGEKEQEQASGPLDHSTVWLWKRREERKEDCVWRQRLGQADGEHLEQSFLS